MTNLIESIGIILDSLCKFDHEDKQFLIWNTVHRLIGQIKTRSMYLEGNWLSLIDCVYGCGSRIGNGN